MFPGAETGDLRDAAYVIVGAPLEVSTSFVPGTKFGPDRIRRFAAGFEDYDHVTDSRFSECGVIDNGDVRAWSDPAEYIAYLTSELRAVRTADAIPLLLGGEHTVTTAGIRATGPELAVLVDAHLDLREAFDGDPWSHATVAHRLTFQVEELVLLGVRAGSESEWDRAAAVAEITAVEPPAVPRYIEEELPAQLRTDNTYLSIDIDGVDPAAAPGTGTREPFGLDPRTVREIVRTVAPSAIGFDVTEVNDRDDGTTAILAAKYLRDFVRTHATQS